MTYKELPKWAQKKAKERVKQQYLELDEEAREAGENVPYYTDKELETVAMAYLNDIDSFELVDYSPDEDGTDIRVEW